MSRTASLAAAKARFAEFVRRAERGESVVLTRHGRPVARLVPPDSGSVETVRGGGEIREPVDRYEARADPLAVDGGVSTRSRRRALERFLEESVWPRIPPAQLGVGLEKREREKILGYGSDGV